jgi:excisionase family DNA binding protein
MTQPLKLDLEAVLDALADRVAEKLRLSMATPAAPSQSAAPRLLTVEQAAAYLSRTKASIQHMISAGRLPTVRADRRVFLDIRDLDAWIEQNKESGIV